MFGQWKAFSYGHRLTVCRSVNHDDRVVRKNICGKFWKQLMAGCNIDIRKMKRCNTVRNPYANAVIRT